MGAVLVTDLLNGAMPLIRYRIGDMAAWADGPCPCGRGLPRLERVAGRVTDFLVGADGRLVSGVYLGHLRRGAAAEPGPGADSPGQGRRRYVPHPPRPRL